MASLHERCFETPRPWRADEFMSFLAQGAIDVITGDAGFAIIRSIADEAELLTLAVDPDQQRKGHGRNLLTEAVKTAKTRGCAQIFLEVSAQNAAAKALYQTAGFSETGRRRAYYQTPDHDRVDALVMAMDLA